MNNLQQYADPFGEMVLDDLSHGDGQSWGIERGWQRCQIGGAGKKRTGEWVIKGRSKLKGPNLARIRLEIRRLSSEMGFGAIFVKTAEKGKEQGFQ